MNIRIFNKPYWVRRFGKQEEYKGYLTSGFEDFAASLHIHPTGSDKQSALPEGERRIKWLEGHGEVELLTANQETGRKGDLVFYFGDWYECTSCQLHHTTMLAHYNYQFVLVPKDSHGVTDLKPPVGDPVVKQEGGEQQ